MSKSITPNAKLKKPQLKSTGQVTLLTSTRATPHGRNNVEMQQHFMKYLRSDLQFNNTKQPQRSTTPQRKHSQPHQAPSRPILSNRCSFTPDLSMTQSFNQTVSLNINTFERNKSWSRSRDRSLELKRQEQVLASNKELTFKPSIEPLNLLQNRKHSYQHGKVWIPIDSYTSRSKFKNIKGMDKFLERSYIAYVNREEQKLMKYNFGKIAAQQKTVSQVVKPSFAYQDIDKSVEVPRQSKLNYMLDGSQKQKLLQVPKYRMKKLTAGVDYKNLKKFLGHTIRTQF